MLLRALVRIEGATRDLADQAILGITAEQSLRRCSHLVVALQVFPPSFECNYTRAF